MLLVKTIPSYAQLQQYIADSDLQTMNSVKYQGKMYLYYNIFAYDGTESLPPMPFQGILLYAFSKTLRSPVNRELFLQIIRLIQSLLTLQGLRSSFL